MKFLFLLLFCMSAFATTDTLSLSIRHLEVDNGTPQGDDLGRIGKFVRNAGVQYTDEIILYNALSGLAGVTVTSAKVVYTVSADNMPASGATYLHQNDKGAYSQVATYSTYADALWASPLDTLNAGDNADEVGDHEFTAASIQTLVQNWIDGSVTNNGFVISANFGFFSYSSDISAVKLIISYNAAPVVGYTADDIIPSAQITQSSAGDGLVTIQFKGKDVESDGISLKTFEYSINGGGAWNAPSNADASLAFSANWTDNGSSYTTAATFAAASAHSFTLNTKHADLTGLSSVDQSDVQIRFRANDGTSDSPNLAVSQSFRVDNVVPTYSSLSPSNSSTVATANIGYTLSEAIASGSVTYTRTGGNADGGSPHVQSLSGSELNAGSYSGALASAPTLVDGTIYTIAFNGTDAAGNIAVTQTLTNITFDGTTESPTLILPSQSGSDNSTLGLSYTLSEAANSGTVSLQFSRTGGNADANAPHIITFAAAVESAATHSFTVDGSDLSNHVNVASVNTDGNDFLVDGAIYTVTLQYQDALGNTAASDIHTSFDYDVSVPVYSSLSPSNSSTVATANVGYTLSEAIASGSVTYTRTGGVADGGSPHVQSLSGSELNTGSFSGALGNAPTLVDGSIYSISFDGTDAAGNVAVTQTITSVTFDGVTQSPTLTTPAASSEDNASVAVSFTLPETALAGSVELIFVRSGGSADAVTHTLTLAGSQESTGAHSFTLTGTDLDAASEVASSSGGASDALVDGTIYTVTLQYQDALGNTAASDIHTNFNYDVSVPVYSSLSPSNSSTVATANVGYTLSEAIASGSVTYTRTGGSADGGSPHAQSLSGSELNAGSFSGALGNAPTLVDGSIYSISFDGTDAAGNAAVTQTITNVTFDAATQTPALTTPASSSEDNASVAVSFTLPETALAGSVELIFVRSGGSADAVTHTLTLAGSQESTGVHSFTLTGTDLDAALEVASSSGGASDALVDGTIYTVTLQYQDALGNTAASDIHTNFNYDVSVPVYSSLSPSNSSTVATANVGYTLSEAIASGSVTYTRTGGSADGGSPHVQSLSGSELNTGSFSGALGSAPSLVGGAVYTISFDGTDAAGNVATTQTLTNITFDISTEVPTLILPSQSGSDNVTLALSYTLPEIANSGTVSLQFSRTGGSVDANAPHVITLAAAVEGAATHSFTINGSDLSNNVNIASVNTDGNDFLVDGAVYTVTLQYQDVVGNTAANDIHTNFTYDVSVPVYSSLSPSNSSTVATANVGYTLSEAIASGSVTFTSTGGVADGSSPHVQSLSGSELNTGSFSGALGNAPTLVDGSIYSISFDGTDAAGNSAVTQTITNVAFDVGTQTPTLTTPAASSEDNASIAVSFTIPETALAGSVELIFVRSSGAADAVTHTLTLAGSQESAGAHSFTLIGTDLDAATEVVSSSGGVSDALVDGAIYTVTLQYQDAASNTATSDIHTDFRYDISAPVYSSLSPLNSSIVATANVGYTLSEAIVSGSVTYTRTGGIADIGSPHVQALSGSELNIGSFSGALGNVPSLVDGAIYTIRFDGMDAAGNVAVTQTITNMTFDATTQTPTLTSPASSSQDNVNIEISFTLPEAALAGSVKLVFVRSSGTADAVTHTLTLAGSQESTGVHSFTLIGTDLDAVSEVVSSSGGASDALIDGTVYTVMLQYQDAFGNSQANDIHTDFTYDISSPVFSSLAPEASSTVAVANVGYSLSENIVSGTVTYARASGTADATSPHIQSLSGSELSTGSFSGALASVPTLVDGTVYNISFDGIDGAGNAAVTKTVLSVLYQTSMPEVAGILDSISIVVSDTSITPWDTITYAFLAWDSLGNVMDPKTLTPTWTLKGVVNKETRAILDTGEVQIHLDVQGFKDSLFLTSRPLLIPITNTDSLVKLPSGLGTLKWSSKEVGQIVLHPLRDPPKGFDGEGVSIVGTFALDSLCLLKDEAIYNISDEGISYVGSKNVAITQTEQKFWFGLDTIIPELSAKIVQDSLQKRTDFSVQFQVVDNILNPNVKLEIIKLGTDSVMQFSPEKTGTIYSWNLKDSSITAESFIWSIVYSDFVNKDTSILFSPIISSPEETMMEKFVDDKYFLFGMPFVPTESSLVTLLQGTLGKYSQNSWRAFLLQDSNFIEVDDLQDTASYHVGEAIWVRQRTQINKASFQNVSYPSLVDFSWSLQPGWNAVSLPFAKAIPWKWIAEANSIDSFKGPYEWDEFLETWKGASVIDSIRPWDGYLFFNKTKEIVKIKVPSFDKNKSVMARPGSKMTKVIASLQHSSEGDFNIVFGEGNSNLPKPPSPVEKVTLSLDGKYQEQFQSMDSSFQLVAKGLKSGERYSLHFQQESKSSVESFYVLDEKRNKIEKGNFDFLVGQESARSFRVFIGTENQLENKISGLELPISTRYSAQWSRNGQIVSLALEVPSPARGEKIVLEVVDAQGRLSKTLLQENVDAGFYHWQFDLAKIQSRAVVHWMQLKVGNSLEDTYLVPEIWQK